MKLNPYAKSARRSAILAHNPDVSTFMTSKSDCLITSWAISKPVNSVQIKAKMLKPKKKRVVKKKSKAKKPAAAPAAPAQAWGS